MNNTQAYQIGYNIGFWASMGAIVALIIWVIYVLIKYKPFGKLISILEDIKWVSKEVGKTLSNEPSFLSSKRIERFIFVVVYVTLTIFWIWHRRNEMSAAEFLMVSAPLMVYAGFNTTQIRIDKKVAANSDLNDKITDNVTDLANKVADKQ